MTARLLGQNTLAGGLRTILNDVIALHGAEFGNIQLAIDDDTLALIEHRGFDEPSLRSLRRVASDGGAASARAFAARKSVVIPDLSKDRALAPYHQLCEHDGNSRHAVDAVHRRGRQVRRRGLDPLRERAHAD